MAQEHKRFTVDQAVDELTRRKKEAIEDYSKVEGGLTVDTATREAMDKIAEGFDVPFDEIKELRTDIQMAGALAAANNVPLIDMAWAMWMDGFMTARIQSHMQQELDRE